MSKVQAFLADKDALILGLNAEPIPARERKAFTLASQVSPDPFSDRKLEWLMREATLAAKYLYLDKSTGTALFVFSDRSILAGLESGMIFAVPSGKPENITKVMSWLQGQGIVEKPLQAH